MARAEDAQWLRTSHSPLCKGKFLALGKVNIRAILDLMESRQIHGMMIAELDNLNACDPEPIPPHQLMGETVSYLKSMGVKFRI